MIKPYAPDHGTVKSERSAAANAESPIHVHLGYTPLSWET